MRGMSPQGPSSIERRDPTRSWDPSALRRITLHRIASHRTCGPRPSPWPSAPRLPGARLPTTSASAWRGSRGVATLPGVDLGPQLVLGWRRGPFALEASALALLPRRHVFDERPELQLRLWMVGGDLCANLVMPVSERLELPIGVGLEAGSIIARGQGVSRPRTARQPWVAARGVVHLVWRPDPRWGLWVGATVVLGVVRPSFTLSDQGPFEVSPGGLRGMMGVQWRWTRATRKTR